MLMTCVAACSYDETGEMDQQLAGIEARVPKGTPLAELPGRMQALGYACDRAVNAGLFCL